MNYNELNGHVLQLKFVHMIFAVTLITFPYI